MSTASSGAGDNVHGYVMASPAPWRDAISYQQRSTNVAALQPSLSTIMQINSIFLW
jgi:hypothetical protein